MIRNRHFVYRNEAGDGGEDGGGGKAEEVVDDKTGEGAKEPEVSAEVIAKAEKMGWTPKDQFRGDPAKWRPADEFVERGENMLPLVKAQVKRQEREIAELRAGMKELGEYHSKTEQRAYEKALNELRQQRAEAIAKGDGAAFDKVDSAIETLKEDIRGKTTKQADSGVDPAFEEWLGRNAWANDPKLQAYGSAVAEELRANGEKATGTDLLDLVTKQIKKDFPEKFENPRRNAAPSVEGGAGPRKSGGKSYADLPAEARAACERMAKNAYSDNPKGMAEFKANYTKTFFEEA